MVIFRTVNGRCTQTLMWTEMVHIFPTSRYLNILFLETYSMCTVYMYNLRYQYNAFRNVSTSTSLGSPSLTLTLRQCITSEKNLLILTGNWPFELYIMLR
jgi:hypothetical protein